MGLFTFSMVAIFLLSRVAGLEALSHGVVFQILLTFVASVAVGTMIMGLHLTSSARTSRCDSGPHGGCSRKSLATAVLSPVVFDGCWRLPGAEPAKARGGLPCQCNSSRAQRSVSFASVSAGCPCS